jgi:hypothetical protein
MGKGTVLAVLTATALIFAVTSTAATGTGGSCDGGYALTSGGVAEADLNSDGVTCESSTLDAASGVLQTIALDNGPGGPNIESGSCPDGFDPLTWAPGVDPDRNGNSIICFKHVNQAHPPHGSIFIDDH